MAAQQASIERFLASAAEASKVILETVQKDGFIHCFSHLDADGIAAAGVMGKRFIGLTPSSESELLSSLTRKSSAK